MNCLIDKSLSYSLKKGKKAEVIRRYIRMTHRIHMDLGSLKKRIKYLANNKLELT